MFMQNLHFLSLANLKYAKPDRLSYLKVLGGFAYIFKKRLSHQYRVTYIWSVAQMDLGFQKGHFQNYWKKQKIFVSEMVMFWPLKL